MVDSERLKEIFARALAIGGAAERSSYLEEACREDPALREQVESLLEAAEQAGDFLDETVHLTPDSLPEPTGTVVGRYKLLQEIGHGGFGLVYMAEQLEPVKRQVALKIIKAGMDTREVIARFEAERQALALMDHPNIARVLDAGATERGRPYFVMELVRGIPITDYCDQNGLSTEERLRLFVKVCHAVQHAHQKGIIHRDLKPGNVLVTLHDGEPVPKVIDFGVAKAIGQKLTERTLFTGFRDMIGTPAYMSPEQAELSGLDIDTRSDIYSLGVLLYELITGAPPFDLETFKRAALDEIRRMIREEEPPKPSTRLQSLGEKLNEVARRQRVEPAVLTRLVRGDVDWIVMKALEKDRRRRYDTPNAMAEDVTRHLSHEPVAAAAPSTLYTVRKFIRRHRMGIATAASFAVLLAAGAAFSTWQAIRATRAERAQTALRLQAEAREKISRAVLLARSGDPETAEEMLGSIPPLLASLDPADAAVIHASVGDWRARQGDWRKAVTAFRRVIEARPSGFDGYHSLAPLLVRTGDEAGYEELRRKMVLRFGDTEDPLLGDRLIKDCLILPWSGPEMAALARLAELGVRQGPDHKAWRRFQFVKGLVEFRQGHFREAATWMREVAESGEWYRDVHRDVQGYMVLAMAYHGAGKPSHARSTMVTGLAVAQDGLPAGPGELQDWPAWNDWIMARALIDEARRMIEGPGAAAPAAGTDEAGEPRKEPGFQPDAAEQSVSPGVAAPVAGPSATAPFAGPSSSLTILPLRLAGRPYDGLAMIVGYLLEQAGHKDVQLGQTVFDPGNESGFPDVEDSLRGFLLENPVATEFTLYAEYNAIPGQGINEMRALLLDRAGRTVWSERLTPEDAEFRQLESPDPMSVSNLLATRLGPSFGLDEETRRTATPGRIARLVEEMSVGPPEAERAAIEERRQAMSSARSSLTVQVFPARSNGAQDAESATDLARGINDAGLCRAVAAGGPASIAPPAEGPDEMKKLWAMAESFRDFIRGNPPEADYALFADYAFTPGRWERGMVHFVVCDRRGDWVIVDLENSEHDDYQSIKPTTAEACRRLVVKRLARYLE